MPSPHLRRVLMLLFAGLLLGLWALVLPLAGLAAAPSEPTSLSYTVKKGDSLWTIAKAFHTTVAKIAERNGLSPNSILAAGARIVLPQDKPSSTSRGLVAPTAYARVQLWSWDKVKALIPVGADYTVTDTKTGESFTARRIGGDWHLDSEPVTPADVQTLKAAYGGGWSWDRRAVVVKYGGVYLAASMNGMPHGSDALPASGFGGMFCIHFLGSRVHVSGAIDPAHQAMVRLAAGYSGPLPQ